VANRPEALGVLLGQQVIAEPAVPVLPFLAADLVHGVGGVVVAVPPVARRFEIALEVVDGFGNLFGLVLAGELQDAGAGGGAGEARADARLVSESAAADVVAAGDVVDGFLHRLVGNVQAAVPGRPQGHHLHDGDRHVGPGGLRLVTPAALAVLAV